MYVVHTTYTAPLEEIDYLLPDHAEWLTRHYLAGHFLASGRCTARTGDVIIATAMSRERLTVILATDPYVANHLARYDVVEFQAGRTAPALIRYNEAVAPTT
ncbi:MAG: hypothetical protein GEV28_03370 [Actinophytocola sp.]|uniref:YciI family protein n=1 Tax=Actinophytocola sp. TaxID=1872138 RepID=UPI0013210DE7|nr:YciI family protein [Actinophytocola sp.]MPZ79474.1 hypothetical protein [Actinophytocola sp.]